MTRRGGRRRPSLRHRRRRSRTNDSARGIRSSCSSRSGDYLQKPTRRPAGERSSGLMVTERPRDRACDREITRVLAVDRMRKVNALIGFTRIDDMDRVNDLPAAWSSSPATAGPPGPSRPKTAAKESSSNSTSNAVAPGSSDPRASACGRPTATRTAATSNAGSPTPPPSSTPTPDCKPPRYWLLHTLAHALIREMAMSCGYAAASLSERLYAWPDAGRAPPPPGC